MAKVLQWALRSLVLVLALSMLVVITAVVVLKTQTGTRWVIDTIDSYTPGDISIDDFTGTLWDGLQIPQAAYRSDEIRLQVSGVELRLDWPTVFAGRLGIDRLYAQAVDYQGPGKTDPTPEPFEISVPRLPVVVRVTESRVGTLSITIGDRQTMISDAGVSDARLDGDELSAASVTAVIDNIVISATGLEATLSGDIPLRLQVQWSRVGSDWAGSGGFSGSLEALDFNHQLAGPYAASANGQLALLNRIAPQVDAIVSWSEWTFGDYRLDDGEVRLNGGIDNYSGDYDVTLLIPGFAPSQVSGTATGTINDLSKFDVNLSNPAGNAELAGSMSWESLFEAEAQVHVGNFDPSVLVDELTGLIDADFRIELGGVENVTVSNIGLTGQLNETTVGATGNLGISPGTISCDRCLLTVGNNEVSVDGDYGNEIESLSFTVDAPSLETLWPEYAGSLRGQGVLVGSASSPRFTGELTGQDLMIEGWSAEAVTVASRASSLKAFDLSASVTSLMNDGFDLGSLEVRGAGAPESVNVDVQWRFREFEFVGEGNVSRKDLVTDVVLASATISEPNTGQWSLEEPLLLNMAGTDVTVQPHAWTSDIGQFRISRLTRRVDEWSIGANLRGLPLQFANSFLPENLMLSGSAEADIDVTRQSDEWTGSINWRQSATELRVLAIDQEAIDVAIPLAEVGVTLQGGGAKVGVKLAVEPGVTGQLDLVLDALSSDSSITAELRLSGDDWYWIPALIPSIDNFEGAIGATVSARGPLLSPEFSGNLEWREGRLAVPALNVPVTDIDVTIAGSSDGAATIQGQAKAGDGSLDIDGRLDDVMRPTRSVSLDIKGDDAEIINWPEYRLWASPDLQVTGTRDGWQFSGKLGIPKAEIIVRELPNEAVTPSADVTVIGREESVEEPTRIAGTVNILLGTGVHVEAFGLDTKLQGGLQVRMFNDRPISAQGRVALIDGFFSAYGQKLTIRSGTLTFTGPLDNPIVDVRAVRVIEALDGSITAGIHLQGRAQTINSTVYSEPAMSDADALSYLVVGRPLSQATESEGGELSSAALALGVRQAGRITDQVGQALGLDQLTVAGDGGDTTALVAGKQLSPRLHARYAYGVFSRLGTLLLRYRLSKRLTLEAGAGEAQSIDLLYLVEKE